MVQRTFCKRTFLLGSCKDAIEIVFFVYPGFPCRKPGYFC